MRLGQRVIPAAGGWRSSLTHSPPRPSFLRNHAAAARLLRLPSHQYTRALSSSSALYSSTMASANGNTIEKSGAPRHNAWIGSAGAAGHDLRSQFRIVPSLVAR